MSGEVALALFFQRRAKQPLPHSATCLPDSPPPGLKRVLVILGDQSEFGGFGDGGGPVVPSPFVVANQVEVTGHGKVVGGTMGRAGATTVAAKTATNTGGGTEGAAGSDGGTGGGKAAGQLPFYMRPLQRPGAPAHDSDLTQADTKRGGTGGGKNGGEKSTAGEGAAFGSKVKR